MHGVTTIGLDIAKSVFQAHGIDAIGKVVTRAHGARAHSTSDAAGLCQTLRQATEERCR